MDNVNDALEQMNRVVTANTKTMSVLGARAMVLGKFLNAVLPQLAMVQRTETTESFRQGIEETLSLMDDVRVPADYHSALLELTNTILATLGHASARHRLD
ncbi:hypothetical protein LMG28614_07199 [Paraburkholderia ultramafica]|uniref:Uncharacterized protein n=1 Tax=Paraburkholderia ultramafica TaxID=1544867 RepID=A0A6S7BQN6_9BURK|nr:hypothetical protein [Paraburkholderia ultramafica]CAB3810088.1 hypothetical protein LMG28614_07199 [Paraburkholderia ultramafica]